MARKAKISRKRAKKYTLPSNFKTEASSPRAGDTYRPLPNGTLVGPYRKTYS